MNILNLNLPKAHFHSLIEYVKSGHTVYNTWSLDSIQYEPSFGIKYLTKEENKPLRNSSYGVSDKEELIKHIEDIITKYDIDLLQVCIPNYGFLHTHFADKLKYIGPTEKSSELETNKLYGKMVAKALGLKVPSIIKQGKYSDPDYATYSEFPYVEKPSYIWNPATVFYNQEDNGLAQYQRDVLDYPRHVDMDYYIEEYIDDMIETNVFFTIANGEYSITHTQQIIGENLNKTVKQNVWYFNSYIKPLEPEVDKIVRQQAGIYLEEIAKMGGRWEGSFCGAYTSKGEWYFLETNVRPDIFNSTPTFMTGDEYLKGMFEDVSLFEKAWENKNVEKLLIVNTDHLANYPIDLHIKYGVQFPNNLEIKEDGNYVVTQYGTLDEGEGAGTVVTDHNIPQEFIKEVEETTTWRFNEEPNL